MAASKKYEEEIVISHDSHGIGMFRMYPNFADSLPIHFEEEFTILCQDFPTSCLLQVILQRDPDGSGVSCKIDINRTDSREISVDTDILVILVPPFETDVSLSDSLTMHGILPNTGGGVTTSDFVSNEVLMQLGSLPVQLKVFFRVHGCHEDKKMVEVTRKCILSVTEKEVSTSKL